MKGEEKVYICRCEEVSKDDIEKAIDEGATTIAGVKRRTHAGMGLCQGRTCTKLIQAMLVGSQEQEKILPNKARPPVRTIKISEFIEGDKE
jgi:NAD(P)H-nitrite reductase large subunit